MRAAIIVVAALTVAGGDQQLPPPLFRAGVDILTVEASVLDGNGRSIADLTPADFTVILDGTPRRVRDARFYNNGEIASRTHSSDAASSAPVTNAADDGRIVVFVVDRDSIAPGAERAILESAASLLEGLRPSDASGVLELPGSATDLTRDHDRVRAAIRRITGSRPVTMSSRDYNVSWDEATAYERNDTQTIARVIERECPDVKQPSPELKNPCPPELQQHAIEMLQIGRMRTQTVLANLSALGKQLQPLRGPKQIVLLSSGFPFGQDLLPLYNNFARRLAEAQIVFYAVHLDQPGDAAARKTVTSSFGGAEFASGLGNAASMTGGGFFMASGTGAGIFARVANEIHSFYELAVELDAAERAPGSFDVEVKVARPGASVRNRRRIVTATIPANGGDRVSEMLRQPIDVGEVPMTLSAYTMRGDDPSTLRTIIGLEAGAAPNAGPAEWGFAVYSEGNVVATGRQKLDGAAGPWAAALSARLLPGKYRLRTAVLDGTNRVGVVERPLEVGLRGTPQVQFSDLLVGVADANGRLQPVSRVLKGAPLSALIEVLSADAGMLEKIRTVIEIIPGGSATPVKRFVMGARSGASAAILNNQAEIPTGDLAVGRYTAVATPMLDDQPLGRVTRIFDVSSRP
jgi:VWFA-related protein